MKFLFLQTHLNKTLHTHVMSTPQCAVLKDGGFKLRHGNDQMCGLIKCAVLKLLSSIGVFSRFDGFVKNRPFLFRSFQAGDGITQ